MNEKAIFEIADIIRIRYAWLHQKLTPQQITKTWEYQMFKKNNPELCHLAEQRNKK